MTRYTLHIPEADNDGIPFDEPTFEVIERELLDIGGGFTTTPGVGGWQGDEQTYREPVRLYHVDTEDPDAGARLLALAERAARILLQEAVYLTRQSIETFLIAPAREEIPA